MSFKLTELTNDAEFPEVARVEHAAYDEPFCKLKQLFFPIRGSAPEDRERAIEDTIKRQWAWHRADPSSKWLKVVDEETRKVVGAGQWHIYESDAPFSGGEDEECDWFPAGEERDAANRCMEQFMNPRIKWMSKPHMLLEACFTLPEYRRHGVGNMILDWGVKIADEKGMEAYIDATDQGIPLYNKHGFFTGPRLEYTLDKLPATPVRAAMEKELLPFEWWPMWRPSSANKEASKPWDAQA